MFLRSLVVVTRSGYVVYDLYWSESTEHRILMLSVTAGILTEPLYRRRTLTTPLL